MNKTIQKIPASAVGKINIFALYFAAFCGAVFIFLPQGDITLSSHWFIALFILSASFFVFCKKLLKRALIILFCVLTGFLFSFFVNNIYRYPATEFLAESAEQKAEIIARVKRVNTLSTSYADYDAYLLSFDGNSAAGALGIFPKIRITAYGGDGVEEGEIIHFTGTLSAPEEVNDSGFREAKALMSRGIFIKCSASEEFRLIACEKPGFMVKLRQNMRRGITKYVGRGVNNSDAALSACMLLGDTRHIDRATEDAFRTSGISHILCVSGLHLSVLFAFIVYVTGIARKKVRRKFPLSEILSCAIAFSYMLLAGFTPSIMRAGFMLIFSSILSAVKYYFVKTSDNSFEKDRIFDGITSLMGATFIITLIFPFSLFDIGMQLSFMSCLGIIIFSSFYERIQQKIPDGIFKYIISSIIITLSAVSFTFIISADSFGTLSCVSVPANLLLSPIVAPLLVLLLFLAVSTLMPVFSVTAFICSSLGYCISFLTRLCIIIAEACAAFPLSLLETELSVAVRVIFLIFAILAFIFICLNSRKLAFLFAAGILALYLCCSVYLFAKNHIFFYNDKIQVLDYYGEQYVSIEKGYNRVYIDDGEYHMSMMRTGLVLGDDRYGTNAAYVLVPTEKTKFESAFFNITHLQKEYDFSAIILPSASSVVTAGLDFDDYCSFLVSLGESDIEFLLYEKSFSCADIDFHCVADNGYSYLAYNNALLFFTYYYSEDTLDIARKLCADGKKCLFFYEKKVKGSNDCDISGFSSLYIQKRHTENIPGTLPLPLSTPVTIK